MGARIGVLLPGVVGAANAIMVPSASNLGYLQVSSMLGGLLGGLAGVAMGAVVAGVLALAWIARLPDLRSALVGSATVMSLCLLLVAIPVPEFDPVGVVVVLLGAVEGVGGVVLLVWLAGLRPPALT